MEKQKEEEEEEEEEEEKKEKEKEKDKDKEKEEKKKKKKKSGLIQYLCLSKAVLNTNKSTKRQLWFRLVKFLVFNSIN